MITTDTLNILINSNILVLTFIIVVIMIAEKK